MAEGLAERHMRSLRDSAWHTISKEGSDMETKKGRLAKFQASIRVTEELKKQKSISTIKRFRVSVNATASQFLDFTKDRLKHYEDIRSLDIEGVAFVTPPTDVDTYHIVDTTRPSEENPAEEVSVMQTLVRQKDNYVVGFRATPQDPDDLDGFFLFNDEDTEVPSFLGKTYRLSCPSNYKFTDGIRVRVAILDTIVDCVRAINKNTCKYITLETRQLIETKMVMFGECPRMHIPLEYVIFNLSSALDMYLPNEVLFFMRNWSYLSKAIFAFYLGLLEIALGVVDAKETFIRGRRTLAAAVKKFKDKGVNLELKGVDGFYSLRKLAGNCVRLLKYDELFVKKLIMRKELDYRARFKLLKHPPQEVKEEDKELDRVADKAMEWREWQHAEGLASHVMQVLLDIQDLCSEIVA